MGSEYNGTTFRFSSASRTQFGLSCHGVHSPEAHNIRLQPPQKPTQHRSPAARWRTLEGCEWMCAARFWLQTLCKASAIPDGVWQGGPYANSGTMVYLWRTKWRDSGKAFDPEGGHLIRRALIDRLQCIPLPDLINGKMRVLIHWIKRP